MKRKGTIKKGIAWLMTAVMVFSITPVMAEPIQAQAEETQVATTTKTIAGLGTSVIKDPTAPASDSDAWKGSYVYYGNYDAGNDGTAEPVKYRVLDASTTEFGGTTMLLDCDSILYYTPFDGDEPYSNVWKDSPIYTSLNGDGFLNKEGVFTTAEKNAIAKSNVASHALTTDSETGVNVAGWTQGAFVNYVALTGEQIFLLDAEDVSNGAYGYSMTDLSCPNRKKEGSSAASWWLRSADSSNVDFAGFVNGAGYFNFSIVDVNYPGVSPALNLNLSSVIFSSVISGAAGETGAEYKLTLLDSDMTIAANGDATRCGNTVTIPYSISGTNSANATQVSVLVLDKEYTAGNTNGATVLDYQKLNVDSFSASGTGTYTLPDSLSGQKAGTDYHVYIVAEDVNGEKETDYASEPLEVEVKTLVDTATVPSIDTPTAEQPFEGEITISSTGVAEKATLTWKKDDTEATGNAEWKTTYQAYVTLTAADGYALADATGNKASVTLNGQPVDTENITLNEDGTLTVACGNYTTATRKTESATAPEVPTQFANYYTAEDVLSSDELKVPAKVTLEGSTEPNPEEMEVEWSIANENDAPYDATPSATNTFKWTVKASEYADYDLNGVTMEGTVTIRNKRYVPEVTSVPTVAERVYHPTKVLTDTDLTGGEVKDKDGTALAGTWSWKKQNVIPSVADSEKTQYEITFTPKDIEHYEPITKTITVKVTKATPVVVAKPSATDIASGNTLASSSLSGGKVQYGEADTTAVAGAWSWKDATIQLAATDSGVTEYTVVFTPKDTVNYETVETKVTVMISTPEVGTTAPSDDGKAIYKVTTSDLTNGTVTYVAPTNKKKTTVTIPDTVTIDGVTYKVTSIEKNAFKNNKKIKKVTIGKNITTIGANAFYNCTKLKTLKLGSNVTTIGDKAFYKCTALTKITIPSKVKTIGKSAFEGCKKLKTVTIGKSVTKIGAKAFYGCSKIKMLTIKSSKLTTKKIGSKAFTKTPKSMKVKVPKKKFKAYKSMLIKRGVNKKAKFKKI